MDATTTPTPAGLIVAYTTEGVVSEALATNGTATAPVESNKLSVSVAGDSGTAQAGHGGVAIAGNRGTAHAGDDGIAFVGGNGPGPGGGDATGGDDAICYCMRYGSAHAKAGGIAISHAGDSVVGDHGIAIAFPVAATTGFATAGDGGLVVFQFPIGADETGFSVGFVGPDGLTPGQRYGVNAAGTIVKAPPQIGSRVTEDLEACGDLTALESTGSGQIVASTIAGQLSKSLTSTDPVRIPGSNDQLIHGVAGDSGQMIGGAGALVAGRDSKLVTELVGGFAYCWGGSNSAVVGGAECVTVTAAGGSTSSGDGGVAVVKGWGNAIISGRGIAIALDDDDGHSSTVTADLPSVIIIGYRDNRGIRRYTVGQIGQDDLVAGQPYTLAADHRFTTTAQVPFPPLPPFP